MKPGKILLVAGMVLMALFGIAGAMLAGYSFILRTG